MRPHTHTKPKPLLPVAGKAVIDHVIDRIQGLPITEYIFITGHLKEQIEEHITENYDFPCKFIEQETMDGTAGAIRLAEPHCQEPVLIIFVDTVFDADLDVIKNCKEDGIIWAQEVEDYQRFGVIVHDDNKHMTKIIEKPDTPISKLANIGLYYIKNHDLLFEGIEQLYDQEKSEGGEYWLTDAFQYMIDKGAKLRVDEVNAWHDCGKPETTLASNAALLAKKHEIKSEVADTIINKPVSVGKDCKIEDSIIGPNVSIADGCTIIGAVLKDVIIDKESTIQHVALHDSILGQKTFIEGSGKEQEYSVFLGDHSELRQKE